MEKIQDIEKRWQKFWKDNKLFEVNRKDHKKFFLNFPYPYINAYPHIGHLYTLMRVETFSRYKRLQGFNTLFAQGWHATGSPIVNAAQRVKEKEEKQIKIMRSMGFSDEQIKEFERPEKWIEHFAPEFQKDFTSLGLSIDWRRNFHTTSLNPHYDKFIRWQFNKLKQGNYVRKGKFPVVWCEKCNSAVGDHSRVDGEGETTQEFCLFKFQLPNNQYLVSATLRPDTVMGITNIYINPDETYSIIKVKDEEWIVGKPVIKKLERQEFDPTQISTIKGEDLIGKYVSFPIGNQDIPILPASFLDSNYGTGIVHSVPSDSADDLIALQNLKNDPEKYNLKKELVQNIEPIEIFNTPEIGANSAQYFLDKYKVHSQNQRDLLDKIKKELYKLTFTKSTFNSKYNKVFSKDLEGLGIEEGQKIIKQDLLKQDHIRLFYELTGKVVCRCLTPSVVSIVDDQWFLSYDDKEWKKLAHKCLDNMKLYPEKARSQFNYVLDWLHKWACTREEGLGTLLPWDEKWVIESLSDSTIYMAYYTIKHILEKIPIENINDELFDYIFLNKKENDLKIEQETVDNMKEEFNYWYPVDFRNSGKDLIQNHLSFFIFNHVAIFPEKHWPKGIGSNGWITVDGEKMSKSKGNMILVREMIKDFGADAARITVLNGGESLDDPNWDTSFAKTIMNKIISTLTTFNEIYNKGTDNLTEIDTWAESMLNQTIKDATSYMEETLFRSSIQKIFFEFTKNIKWYLNRSLNRPNKEIFNKIHESLLIMLSPFTPHICEEYYNKLNKQDTILKETWPTYNQDKINENLNTSEELIEEIVQDINKVIDLSKTSKPKKITLIVSKDWKYDFLEIMQNNKEIKNPGEMIKVIMQDQNLKRYGKEITKLIPKIIFSKIMFSKIPAKQDELNTLKDSVQYLKEKFNTEIEIQDANKYDNKKSDLAFPKKPAILLE